MPTKPKSSMPCGRSRIPESHRSIVDLDMVRGIAIEGDRVRVTVALTVAGLPAADRDHPAGHRRRRVTWPASRTVDVDLTVMTDEERQALTQQLQRRLTRRGGPARTRSPTPAPAVLAIASGKGGVGKSSVTTNLAVALAQRGHKVAAVDADVWGFSMPRMLGIDRPPTVIDDVIVPPEANGVTLISMGFFAREDQPVVWRGPMLHKALEQFLTDVHWGEPDYLVVDMPPGTGDIALSMAQFLPRAEVVVVTTPQPAAQKVAQRAAYMARKVNLGVVGVIENMSWFECDHGQRVRALRRRRRPGAGRRPRGAAARSGAARARAASRWRRRVEPIVVARPDDPASVAFRTIAERLDVELAPKRIYRTELKIM